MAAPTMTPAERALAVEIVDALNAVFGVHPGARAAHAKGIVCRGTFTPSADAQSVSKAAHLQRDAVPITVRFSNNTGLPDIPDGNPDASPRGMAIRFHLGGDAVTDVLGNGFEGFPVANGADFAALFRAIAASGPGTPSPTPIETFLGTHPAALRFVEAPKATPASYCTEAYFGQNAFRFTNAAGTTRAGRYRILPVAGIRHLEAADAAGRHPDFLTDELRERLRGGPAQFRLVVQVAQDGDPTHDVTQTWPADRPQIELGVISIEEIVADSTAAERGLIFDPTNLTDGIALGDDPLPRVRSQAYSISFERRLA